MNTKTEKPIESLNQKSQCPRPKAVEKLLDGDVIDKRN